MTQGVEILEIFRDAIFTMLELSLPSPVLGQASGLSACNFDFPGGH